MMFVQFQVTVPSGFSQSVEREKGCVASSPVLVKVMLRLAMFHVAFAPIVNVPQSIDVGSLVMFGGVWIRPWFRIVKVAVYAIATPMSKPKRARAIKLVLLFI